MVILESELEATPSKQQERPPVPTDPSYQFSTSLTPPSFEDSFRDHTVLHFSQTESYAPLGGEEPPAFTPYDATYFTSGTGDVISHDPHLNEDGEALYRFLLSQASTPPRIVLHCKGSHRETHTRMIHSPRHGGHTDLKTERYTETVVDFDFKIDIGQHIFGDVTHWSVGDSVPAYRGNMFREVGIDWERRAAGRAEIKAAKAWDNERNSRGFPPWIGSDYAWKEDQPHIMHTNSVLKSSWTLRQWADDYCSSKKLLKEFEYRKVVYGWNFNAIKAAATSVISSTHYRGDLVVSFETSDSIIYVRSQNRLARALSNGWIKLLLIITLIYPFVWLYQRFHPRGGGTWRVCGGAYALKRVEKATSTPEYPSDAKYPESPFQDPLQPGSTFGEPSGSANPSDAQTRAVGLREGVWFRKWEGTIRRAVLNRLQITDPLTRTDDGGPLPPTIMLDGY